MPKETILQLFNSLSPAEKQLFLIAAKIGYTTAVLDVDKHGVEGVQKWMQSDILSERLLDFIKTDTALV